MSLFVTQTTAYALPAGGQVSAGSADISYAGARVNVTQATNNAVINWNSFNIGSDEAVQFYQPSASSIALNRIHGANPSAIDGSLNANGQVWLINPNGVMFGKNAQVNVGGLLATTSDIDNGRFISGDYTFTHPGNPLASIFNYGHIQIADGGIAALVGPNVTNDGLIDARLGKVQLGSGDTFTLDLYGDGLINLAASPSITSQLISNNGSIIADGGSVLLTAAAAGNVVNSLIDMSGIIQANSVGNQDGHVTLYAEGSNAVPGNIAADKGLKQGESLVQISGTINAIGQNAGETGGTIAALADWVGIKSGATLNASGNAGGGTIMVGGDFNGAGDTPTATTTVVEGSTNLYANATSFGKGGIVAVWSDNSTSFSGNIEAEGGPNGGDGGFVETSGHELMGVGTVNAGAPHGNAGTWLIDPTNILIDQTTCTGAGCFSANSIGTSLGTTNVTITTTTGSITLDNSTTITDSGSATTTLDFEAGTDIYLGTSAAITNSGTGKLNVTFDADTATGGGAIYMDTGSSITTLGGNITMGGQGTPLTKNAVGDATYGNGITIYQAMLAAGNDGNITLNGTGYGGGSGSNNGVYIYDGAAVTTTGSGNITIVGTGGTGSGGYNDGIHTDVVTASTNTQITTVNGNISVTGTGGASSAAGNIGILFDSNYSGLLSNVAATGSGNITLNGTGGGTGASTGDTGVVLGGAGTSTQHGQVSVATGNISIAGTGATGSTGGSNYGVDLNNYGTIQTTSTGTVSITGTGGGGASDTNGNDYGIYVESTGKIQSTASGGGGITIHGTGGDAGGSGGTNVGIWNYGGTISSVDGNISITGAGGNSSGSTNWGIAINNSGAVSASGNASITLSGTGVGSGGSNFGVGIGDDGSGVVSVKNGNLSITGNASATDSSGSDYGVYIGDSSIVQTTGTGNISITGNGSTTDSGGNDYGVYVNGGTVETTSSGTITLNGTGGGWASDTVGDDYGVLLGGSGLVESTATGGGAITIQGTASTSSTGGSNQGVVIGNYVNGIGSVTSVDGNISIAGNGGSGSGNNNEGVTIGNNASSFVKTTGAGNISITGYGGTTGEGAGNNQTGVEVYDGGSVQATSTGSITVKGTGGSGTGGGNYGLYMDGTTAPKITAVSGTTTLEGIAGASGTAASYGFDTDNTSSLKVGTSGTTTGATTIIADTINWGANTKINTTGVLTVEPYTSGTTMSVGNTLDTLQLPTAVMTSLQLGNPSSIIFGSSITGAMNVNYTTAFAIPATFITGSGNAITISGALESSYTSSSTNALTLTSGGAININAAVSDTNATSTNTAIISLDAGSNIISNTSGSLGSSGTKVNYTLDVDTGGSGGYISLADSVSSDGGSIAMGGGIGTISAGSGFALGNSSSGTQYGIYVTKTTVNSAGGTIIINGEGGTYSSGNNYGVYIDGSTIETTSSNASNSATISIAGEGGNSGSSSANNDGIYMDKNTNTSAINTGTSGSGTITMVGISGSSTSGTNYGFASDANTNAINNATGTSPLVLQWDNWLPGSSSTTWKTAGKLLIEPYTANTPVNVAGSASNLGITGTYLGYLTYGSLTIGNTNDSGTMTVSNNAWTTGLTLNSGSGDITIANGSGSLSFTHALNINTTTGNVLMQASADIVESGGGNITTQGGNIVLDANSGGGTSGAISLGSNILTSNGGTIDLGGGSLTSGLTTGSAYGDSSYASGIHLNGTTLDAGSGNLTLAGNGYTSGALSGYYGVDINASTVETTGAGRLTVQGTGGGSGTASANYGVYLSGAGVITGTSSGTISVTGIDGSGSGGSNYGFATDSTAGNKIGTGSGTTTGNITLITNDMSVNTLAVNTTGNITIAPYTSGGTVGVGSGSGNLSVTNAILGDLSGYSTLTIGSTTAGAMDINTSTSFSKPVNFLTGAATADITLDGQITDSVSGAVTPAAIVIASGRNIINNYGSTVFNLTGASSPRWLLYSANPANDTTGGLTGYTKRYNKTYAGYAPSSVIETGDVWLYSIAPVITVTANNASKTYGAANPSFSASYSGFIDGDTSGTALTGSPSLTTTATSSSNVGTYTITSAAGSLASAMGYTFNYVNGTLTVTTAPLTITASNQSKTYGFGGTSASLGTTAFTVSGLQGSDAIDTATLSTNATLSSSSNYNAGTWTLTPSAAHFSTGSAGNYTITYDNASTGLTIAAKALTITGLSGTDKVYDSTTADPVTGSGSLSGIVSGLGNAGGTSDVVSLSNGTAAFADPNVGTGKTVSFSGYSISGADAADYSLSQPASSTANITAAGLTITASNQSKTYGFGGTSASLGTTAFTTSGLLGSDSVTSATLSTNASTSTSGNYNAGTWTITLSAASGSGLSNYSITYDNASTGLTIAQKALTITGLSGTDKVYDSTTADPITGSASLSGNISGDVVNQANGSAAFGDPNVGTGKTVTFSGYSISGARCG